MKIRVKQGKRIYTSGGLHLEDDEVDLPAAEARAWVSMGRADEVKATAAADDDKPKDAKPKK